MLIALLLWAAGDTDVPLRMEFEPPKAEVRLAEVQSGHLHLGIAASAQARVSIPFGAADSGDILVSGNTIFITNRVQYLDLFHAGYGFTLEGDILFRPPERSGYEREPTLGLYVAFEYDWFGGNTADAEPATRIHPDTMKLASTLVGFKAEGPIQGDMYGAVRGGVGAVHYPSLMADFDPAGGVPGRGELFRDTWTFAMELRIHFGWKAGPLQLFFGFGGRLYMPPDSGANSTLDPSLLFLLDFEIGAELGF